MHRLGTLNSNHEGPFMNSQLTTTPESTSDGELDPRPRFGIGHVSMSVTELGRKTAKGGPFVGRFVGCIGSDTLMQRSMKPLELGANAKSHFPDPEPEPTS